MHAWVLDITLTQTLTLDVLLNSRWVFVFLFFNRMSEGILLKFPFSMRASQKLYMCHC